MRKYLYADEAGNFDFSGNPGASQYFVITTVMFEQHDIELALLDLRRELAWEGLKLPREFHATEDRQVVRDQVFEVLSKFDFRIDATVLDKSKASMRIKSSDEQFYQYACYYHLQYVAPSVVSADDELLVIAASIGSRQKLANFRQAVSNVAQRTSPTERLQCDAWSSAATPCLQVADYCCWAIQRKWERNDSRSYELIKGKLHSEYDIFSAWEEP